MPAFQAQPPPMPDANTGTPLSELHRKPERPPPAAANEPAQQAAKAKKKAAAKKKATPPSAASRAARAARTRVPAALRKAAPKAAASVQVGPAKVAPTRDASVADLQNILNKRGAKLKKDGLYGPKTAGAWSAAARGEGLPTTITRVGPKVARVIASTYEALAS
jgi:peptidoglycan hydrolase-like protein with peptidoglycan-binding domain